MSLFKNMNWSPLEYAEARALAHEVGEEMLSRLEWMTLKPHVILDLGCGTGEMSGKLREKYHDAHVISLDISEDMIKHAKQADTKRSCVCADAASLPFANQSVDLIFANLLFPWQDDFELLLRECRRVLRADGLLMFTLLGPDTLREMNRLTPVLMDMHDVGDLILQMKLADPVIDVNYYTLTYREQEKLFKELLAIGMLQEIPEMTLPVVDGKWEATFEVIFAHAFMPAESDEVSASEDGVVRIPLSHLRRQLRV